MSSPKHKLRKFEVGVPCQYHEIYIIWAHDEEQALELVKDGEGECIGESTYGHNDYFVQELTKEKKENK